MGIFLLFIIGNNVFKSGKILNIPPILSQYSKNIKVSLGYLNWDNFDGLD